MLKKLRQWFRESRHVHIRGRSVNTLSDMVGLIDRFIDGRVRYRLEWDDFISWGHENKAIEAYRDRIASLEPLFFSKDPADRAKAIADLLEQRNAAAALCGMSTRVALAKSGETSAA